METVAIVAVSKSLPQGDRYVALVCHLYTAVRRAALLCLPFAAVFLAGVTFPTGVSADYPAATPASSAGLPCHALTTPRHPLPLPGLRLGRNFHQPHRHRLQRQRLRLLLHHRPQHRLHGVEHWSGFDAIIHITYATGYQENQVREHFQNDLDRNVAEAARVGVSVKGVPAY